MISDRKRETLIDDTINKIMTGQIIPLIGDDVFLIKDENGTEYKINDYVTLRLIERSGIAEDIQPIYEKARKGFKGMTYLKNMFNKEFLNLDNEIRKLYREENIVERAYLTKEVHEFLTRRKFPLIITTSYSNILENKLGGKYKSAYYMKQKTSLGSRSVLQDVGEVNSADEHNRLKERTIYHILGNISQGYECALTDNDFLQYLHHLHDTNSRPDRLLEYINERRFILALGCDIPDWTLRFLLYSFITEIRKKETVAFNGGVIDTKKDENLEEFLLNIDYYYEDVNQKMFISRINEKLPPEEKPAKIFISVLSDDIIEENNHRYNIEQKIVETLKKNHDVWYCPHETTGLSGEHYWNKIRQGLKECDYFMPIITHRVLKEFSKNISVEPQPDKERGIITEWKYALRSWIEEHGFKEDFVKPVQIMVDLEDVRKVFLSDENDGKVQLRQLVYGKEIEQGVRTGLQIGNYTDIDNLILKK